MTLDEFQAVCRWPEYEVPKVLLELLSAITDVAECVEQSSDGLTSALGDVAEFTTRLCWELGWRLASLATEEESSAVPAAAQRVRAMLEAGRALCRMEIMHPAERNEAEIFQRLRVVWHAARDIMRARGLDPAMVLAHRANRFGQISPLPPRWRPPPRPADASLVPTERFTLRFHDGAASWRQLSINGSVVTLESPGGAREEVDFANAEVAIVAFEVNARAFENDGLRCEAACSAALPGILEPLAYYDAPLTYVWFQGDRVVEAHISQDDPVGFFDSLLPAARRTTQPLGRFVPGESLQPGIVGIHLLRRLFSHPAARSDGFELALTLADSFIDPVLDWLLTTSGTRHVRNLTLLVPETDRYGPILAKPRPLGAQLPQLRVLRATYRSWPLWSAAPFPHLQSLTLETVPWSKEGPEWQPAIEAVAKDVALKARRLSTLKISAFSGQT